MEVISSLIKCTYCEKIMQKPVVLPCGHSICKHHEDEIRSTEEKTKCSICLTPFEIPSSGLIPVKVLEELIEKKIQSLDLGEEYNLAAKKCQEYNDLLERIKQLKNSSEDKIHSTIGDLRARIDLKREELKSKIDEEALKLIEELDDYEAQCFENLTSLNKELEEKIASWEDKLKKWKENLGTFERDVGKWKTVFDQSTLEMVNLSLENKSFERKLFLNRFFDYTNSNLYIDNEADMIKNNTISIKVEKVRSIEAYKDSLRIFSDRVKALGIEWRIAVDFEIYKDSNQKEHKYIEVFLFAKQNPRIFNYKVDFDIQILCRSDSKNNPTKTNLIYEFVDNKGYGLYRVMELNDLLNNQDLYDSETDSFTAQVIINSIQCIKI